jgi:hypothetical protein
VREAGQKNTCNLDSSRELPVDNSDRWVICPTTALVKVGRVIFPLISNELPLALQVQFSFIWIGDRNEFR